jgi:hypothetical protein
MHGDMFEVALHGGLLMVARVPSNIGELNVSLDYAHVCASHGRADVGVEAGLGAERQSEHGVVVGGLLWNRLQHIPVFDNLAVL